MLKSLQNHLAELIDGSDDHLFVKGMVQICFESMTILILTNNNNSDI